ncbi:MAG: NAD(P)/FAD-dependent oxidoreductase [Flavobacterium sp.]|nr:NAD(P)/FAD-dependent oxidoreductase [Flavobacterium sp.]
MSKKTALIIGGGPAGLTAAYEFLKNTDIQPVVIEMSAFWGGISRTETQNGNRIDIGGHRFFSKSDEVMQWWQDILPIYSEEKELSITYHNQNKSIEISKNDDSDNNLDNILLVRKRKSRIYYNQKFFNYPISLNFETLQNLGFLNSILIGFSYIQAVIFPIKNVLTLEDFFINRFGNRLYKTFFKDYTEKVWGVPCNEISAEWGAQRIRGLSVTKTLLNALKKSLKLNKKTIQQKDTETSLIEYFLYPKYGPGQMWEVVADKIQEKGGILKQNSKVTAINFENNKVKNVQIENALTNQTEIIPLDYCISTMPVNELINSFNCNIPEDVKKVSDGLLYRDFITVGLLLDTINHDLEDNWIYIQENYVKVGRLQIFNNWSPFMVKDNTKTWVGLEYFCNITDDLWNKTNDSLVDLAIDEMIQLGFINDKNEVSDSKVIRVPKTYPAYFGTYSEFDTIKNFTNTFENLFLVGRNGMHKYNNQDHSMLTAMKSVQNIKNNVSDKENIWSINTEEEYHEEQSKT